VHRFENPKVPVQLVLSRIVANRPAGTDRDGTRADAVHDAIRAAQELHQIIDQLGIVEVHRCHKPQARPGVAAAGPHISLWRRSKTGQLDVGTGCLSSTCVISSPADDAFNMTRGRMNLPGVKGSAVAGSLGPASRSGPTVYLVRIEGGGFNQFGGLPLPGMSHVTLPVLDQKETEVTLAALRNRRAEIERWLDGPAKKATLSALGRVIAELERQKEASAHREAAVTRHVTGDVAAG
jgi:hypothetical protein